MLIAPILFIGCTTFHKQPEATINPEIITWSTQKVAEEALTEVKLATQEVKTVQVDPYILSDIKIALESKFGSEHPLIEVARCESTYKQFREDGTVLKNPTSSAMGIFQIMAYYHRAAALKLGMDIDTIEGNINFAEHLYNTQGLTPWTASEYCWGPKVYA